MMILVKVLMNLSSLGLKALKYAHYMISGFFPTNDENAYVGLQNLGNTCYCNSIVQVLYFCAPFRNKLLQYYCEYGGSTYDEKNKLLTCLADLFHQMNSRKTPHVSPQRFVELVMEDNEIFSCSEAQQDAHEFLIFLLNNVDQQITIWNNTQSIREIFGGAFTNETRCLCCESVTCREEPFMDVSVEIQQNSSLSSCLNAFSAAEKLFGKNKYWCDMCCHFQEAEKRLRINSAPQILVCQLKRFKYTQHGEVEGFKKLCYRVAFPMELRLPVNSRADEDAEDPLYSLFGVVVHVGRRVNCGHYIALVNSGGQWVKFDDEKVEIMEESELEDFFGSSETAASDASKDCNAYILFYQAVNGFETT